MAAIFIRTLACLERNSFKTAEYTVVEETSGIILGVLPNISSNEEAILEPKAILLAKQDWATASVKSLSGFRVLILLIKLFTIFLATLTVLCYP